MEFLIHNISHSDLIVELSWLRDDDATDGAVQSPSPATAVPHGVDATVAVADHITTAPPSTDTECKPNGASNGGTTTANGTTKPAPRQYVTKDGVHVPLTLLARPKFSLVQQISQAIMERVEELRHANRESSGDSPTRHNSPQHLHPSMLDIVSDQMATTATATATASAGRGHRRVKWKATCHDTQSPIGFKLHQSPIVVTNWVQDFRLRGGLDTLEIVQKHWKRVAITAVYFPLIALLLPKWLQVLNEFKSSTSQQLVYLISGAGIPRNVSHSMQGNSTETTAKLIAIFVHQYYPQMEVHQVHSGSNIFRFDGNVHFMTRELRPRLEAHRDTIVAKSGEAWKSHFHVTIAYADGPPARLSALNASLRIFRPSYLHVWQLKTYWHEQKLSMDDVDFHSFENIEASPTVFFHDADEMTQLLIQEMRIFRDQFLEGEHQGEVGSFWLRKSRKPVLAVLLIEKVDETGHKTLVVHRGMNCEVSMPTGSLCAERNAIGSALARDPTLRRQALKMIGVLGVNLDGSKGAGKPPVSPSSSTTGSITTAPADSSSMSSLFAGIPHAASLVTAPPTETSASASSDASTSVAPPPPLRIKSPTPQATNNKRSAEKNTNLSSPRKPKRPRTFSCDDASVEAALHQQDQQDRNPLAPCGACKEWLLKIAEVNPSFRVVTFENARCRNVYINQIM